MTKSVERGARMSEASSWVPIIPRDPVYPDSDGEPMADNTLQYEWIVTLQGGFDDLLEDFVGGDLLWYPVHGEPKTRVAPDVLVALGRPKGHRGSYKQWAEGGVPPTLVVEVLSPSNTESEMLAKVRFYDRYGVREVVIYDPDSGDLEVWVRGPSRLERVAQPMGWTSPSTGVTLSVDGTALVAVRPDGRRFLSYLELSAEAREAREEAREAWEEARAARTEARAARTEAREARTEAREARTEAHEAWAALEAAKAREAALAEALREALARRG
jgi:Uma2 family endonuclease